MLLRVPLDALSTKNAVWTAINNQKIFPPSKPLLQYSHKAFWPRQFAQN